MSDIHSLIVFGGGGGSGWSMDLKKPGLSAGFDFFSICIPVVPLFRTGGCFFGVRIFLVLVTKFFVPLDRFVTTLGVPVLLETFFVLAVFKAALLKGSQLPREVESEAACAPTPCNNITDEMSSSDFAILTGRTPAEGTPQKRHFRSIRCHDAGRRIAKSSSCVQTGFGAIASCARRARRRTRPACQRTTGKTGPKRDFFAAAFLAGGARRS
ncbi:MAG: hypothetical protein HY288_14315 [Planctomycetia bacterium]|nr:hypothetical protein [Planctomycetia bacterium]